MDQIGARSLAGVQGEFKEMTSIVTDNVTKYYYEGNDQEYWDLRKDFPNVAPPFQAMFLDTCRPEKIVSKEVGITTSMNRFPSRWGAFFLSSDIRKDPEFREQFLKIVREGAMNNQQGMEVADAWDGDKVRWLYFSLLFMYSQESGFKHVAGPVGSLMLSVDEDGLITYTDKGNPACLIRPHVSEEGLRAHGIGLGKAIEMYAEEMTGLYHPLLLAISFMHCKNVSVDVVDRPEKLVRKWKKNDDPRAEMKYHTLSISQMQSVLRKEGNSESAGLKRALHICRGRFRDYRQRGLFGKHKGVYWFDQHVRGTASAGAIRKDYEVKADGQEERSI